MFCFVYWNENETNDSTTTQVVVTTEGWHAQHRGYLNVYLVDVVSGGVVFSASHRRVGAGAVHVVHAENWVVYAFYNDKVSRICQGVHIETGLAHKSYRHPSWQYRRTEVASLELFEGKRQGNSTDFSSFEAPQPLVDRQAYIYPAHITAMKDTFSEKGMTAKHILRKRPASVFVRRYHSMFTSKKKVVLVSLGFT